MGVFISRSGKNSISYKVAMLLRDWLPNVIQTVKPFLSAVDIDAGSQWTSQMFQALKETQVGIICVTRTNQAEPWINFEAGALAKAMESSRVCPLLIDVRPTDVCVEDLYIRRYPMSLPIGLSVFGRVPDRQAAELAKYHRSRTIT
jgi:hypothetical protein